jgi:hypothetical protein
MGVDPIELRRKNWVRVGDPLPLATALGEAREGFPQLVTSCGLRSASSRQWLRSAGRSVMRSGAKIA